MKSFLQRIKSIPLSESSIPWALLGFSILAYGLLIPWLGFYGDDWSYIWLLKTGTMQPFFAHNRAILAPIYEVIAKLLGLTPWPWHVLILLVHWGCAMCFWQLLRLLWPQQAVTNAMAAVLFVLYPSFLLQSGAVTFWLVFAQFTLFLLSFIWGIKAIQSQKNIRWIFLTVSLLAELLNLVISEYFFFLELLRPILYWLSIGRFEPSNSKRIKKAGLFWLPSLVLYIGDIFWRTGHQAEITGYYKLSLLSDFSKAPLSTVGVVLSQFANDIRISLLETWKNAAFPAELKGVSLAICICFIAALVLCALATYAYYQRLTGTQARMDLRTSGVLFGLGFLSLFLAGGSFRMAGISLGLEYSNSRFSIPHILGNCLLLAGLINLIPRKTLRGIVWAGFIALAVSMQFLAGNVYRMDWNMQRSLYWQLARRMPELQPGTMLVFNKDPIESSEENALSGVVNFIYTKDPTPFKVDYYLYFIPERVQNEFGSLEPGKEITTYHLIGNFHGSTSQVIGIYQDPSGCIRVLDPALDGQNNRLSTFMHEIAAISTVRPIRTGEELRNKEIPQSVFGSDPTPGWCANYQHADLSRQLGRWREVTSVGDQISSPDVFSPDPLKYYPYIEGYAHTGQWDKAARWGKLASGLSPNSDKLLCMLLQRIDQDTPGAVDKDRMISEVKLSANCQ